MSLTKRFADWAIKLHTETAQSGGAVYVDGIKEVGVSSALASALEGSDGAAYNTFASLVSGGPTARFSTTDLKVLMDECSAYMLVDAGVNPGVVFYFQAYAQGATRSASGAMTVTVANGVLVLRQLELSHQQPAMLSAELIARQDGATAPLAVATSQSLPAVYPATSVLWTLGKVDFNGTQIEGVESVSVDFGVDVLAEGSDSDVYPTFVAVRKVQPKITIRGAHVDVLATLTVDGAQYTAGQIVLYARKRSEGGTFVADGTAEHVSLTLGKCRVDWNSVDGDPKKIDLTLSPYYTAGGSPTLPITINTATAIT